MVESSTAKDVKRLMRDNDKLKSRLERLEQDHAAWALSREEKDLQEVMDLLKQLEMDVSVMAGDCSSLASRHSGNGFGQELHHVYVHLNMLFEDVKEARTDLQQAYIQRKEIDQMEIDWKRLNKAVAEIGNNLAGLEATRTKRSPCI